MARGVEAIRQLVLRGVVARKLYVDIIAARLGGKIRPQRNVGLARNGAHAEYLVRNIRLHGDGGRLPLRLTVVNIGIGSEIDGHALAVVAHGKGFYQLGYVQARNGVIQLIVRRHAVFYFQFDIIFGNRPGRNVDILSDILYLVLFLAFGIAVIGHLEDIRILRHHVGHGHKVLVALLVVKLRTRRPVRAFCAGADLHGRHLPHVRDIGGGLRIFRNAVPVVRSGVAEPILEGVVGVAGEQIARGVSPHHCRHVHRLEVSQAAVDKIHRKPAARGISAVSGRHGLARAGGGRADKLLDRPRGRIEQIHINGHPLLILGIVRPYQLRQIVRQRRNFKGSRIYGYHVGREHVARLRGNRRGGGIRKPVRLYVRRLIGARIGHLHACGQLVEIQSECVFLFVVLHQRFGGGHGVRARFGIFVLPFDVQRSDRRL